MCRPCESRPTVRRLDTAKAGRSGLVDGNKNAALRSNENLTAAQAGNSPAMIHAHYKGLATKAEAEKWFKVKPAKNARNIISLAHPKSAFAAGRPARV